MKAYRRICCQYIVMEVFFYSVKDFEKEYLERANNNRFKLGFTAEPLSPQTVELAKGYKIVSPFSSDDVSAPVIELLQKSGIGYIALRASGFDNVNIEAANEAGIVVANVPDFSPHAVAEHAVLMMLALSRKIILSHEQVSQQNFTVNNLIGFDLHKKKVGIIGTGRVGHIVAKILHGFGCTVMAHDTLEDQHLMNKYDVHYVGFNTLCSMSDIITIHLPLTKATKYLINERTIKQMKKGVMLINTARGAIVKTEEVLKEMETGHIGYFGMDVYEKEKGVFFYDHSTDKIEDPLLIRLMSLPNVLITPHHAFVTKEALANIASVTFHSIYCWSINGVSENELTYRKTSERLVP